MSAIDPTGRKVYKSYTVAEFDCDQIAGDCEAHMAVVELFYMETPVDVQPDDFCAIVVPYSEAMAEVAERGDDVEIIYDNDQTPETRAKMQ